MFKKILVPLDGSRLAEQILPYVRLFAGREGVPVDLLWVNDPQFAEWPPRPGKEYLHQTKAKYLSALKEVDAIEVEGEPADEIIRRAAVEPDCLVAMATHGVSGLRRWLLGSVASKVVQLAQNPLLLVRPSEALDPTATVAITSIIVPLDGSGCAEQALPHAVASARKFKGDLQLVRVYSLPTNAYIVGDGVIAPGPTQFRDALKSEVAIYLDGKVETLRAQGVDCVVSSTLEGDPASEIIDLAANTTRSLIIMSTHGRSGIGRWLLGSVAEKIVQHSRAPVLLIRSR